MMSPAISFSSSKRSRSDDGAAYVVRLFLRVDRMDALSTIWIRGLFVVMNLPEPFLVLSYEMK